MGGHKSGRALIAGVVLLSVFRGDCIALRPEDHRTSRPYTEMISPAMDHCYRMLVNDSSCCLDTTMIQGIANRSVHRPGTDWDCVPPECVSSVRGHRGDDLVWLPTEVDCSSPRVLYVHGGGWSYGSPVTSGYAEFAAKLAHVTGAMVMVPDYPLVSGNSLRKASWGQGNYSAIMNASISALRWLVKNGPTADCPEDPSVPLFIGGDSSGGGSALSLAILLSTQPDLLPGRNIRGVFLYSPWTNLMCNSPEYYHNAFARIEESSVWAQSLLRMRRKQGANYSAFVGDIIFRPPPRENSERFIADAEGYTGFDTNLLTDSVASPYYAGPEQLQKLPPLYISVGGSESILGDSIVVAEKAANSGVHVHLDVHPGMWHVFPMYSEGCGSGHPLWNGLRVLNYTALFVRHLSETSRPPYTLSVRRPLGDESQRLQPYTTVSYNPAVPSLSETDAVLGEHLEFIKEFRSQNLRKRVGART